MIALHQLAVTGPAKTKAADIATRASRMGALNSRSSAHAKRMGGRLESRIEYAPKSVALHFRHPKEPE